MPPKSKSPAEYWTEERCFITEHVNRDDLPSVSVARARVEPGVTTQRHVLSVDEWYVITAGSGRVFVGPAAPADVGSGDTVHIPAGCEQRITNTGAGDLLFLCVCVPRFVPAAYRALE